MKTEKELQGLIKLTWERQKDWNISTLLLTILRKKEYKDMGPVFYEDGAYPTYVNSIAIDDAGNVYTLARFMHDGKEIEDLIKIQLP